MNLQSLCVLELAPLLSVPMIDINIKSVCSGASLPTVSAPEK